MSPCAYRSILRSLVLFALFTGAMPRHVAAGNGTTTVTSSFQRRHGFTENKGQLHDQRGEPNPSVLYMFDGPNFRVQLRRGGFSYDLARTDSATTRPPRLNAGTPDPPRAQLERIDLDLVDAALDAPVTGDGRSTYFLNYYTTGTPADGVTDVHTYARVTFHEVYPHIDLEFTTDSAGAFKYNFIIGPGGDLSDIRLHISGAKTLRLADDGIRITGRLGAFTERIPACTWTYGGRTVSVEGRFVHVADGDVGIALPDHAHIPAGATVVIDPQPDLQWCTYYGGSGYDYAIGLVRDPDDNSYVCGYTYSLDLIATLGAWADTANANVPLYSDACLAKFDPNGQLVWGTYYGGSRDEMPSSLAIRDAYDIMLAGTTNSPDHISPWIGGSVLHGTDPDGYIARFHMGNGRLNDGEYIGGNNFDGILDIAMAPGKRIVMCGTTASPNMATPGAFQTSFDVYDAGFILVMDSSMLFTEWCTYVADPSAYEGDQEVKALCVDAAGDIYCAAYVPSTGFPISPNAFQQEISSLVVAKFNTHGQYLWSTHAGGAGFSGNVTDMVLDGDALALVGFTDQSDLVTTPGAYQSVIADNFFSVSNFVLITMDTSGTQSGFSTYFGLGHATEFYTRCPRIRTDGHGYFYLVGLVMPGHEDVINSPGQDLGTRHGTAFLAKFDHAGIRQWSFGIGGNVQGPPDAVVLPDGGARLVFTTQTPGLATPGVHQTENYQEDMVLVELGPCPDTLTSTGAITGPTSFCPNQSGVVFHTEPVAGALEYQWTIPPGASFVGDSVGTTITVDLGSLPGVMGVRAHGLCNAGPLRTLPVGFAANCELSLAFDGPAPVCVGDAEVLQVTGGNGNYIWQDQFSGPTRTITADGNYQVTSMDDSGCVIMSNVVTVSLTPKPMPIIQGPTSAHVGDQDLLYEQANESGDDPVWHTHGGYASGAAYNYVFVSWYTPGLDWVVLTQYTFDHLCSGTDTLFVNVTWDPDGITTNADADVRVFPAPADDRLLVDLGRTPDHPVEAEVLDDNGRAVLRNTVLKSDRNRMDVSGLADGLYVLRLRRNGTVASYRFAVQHAR